MERIGFIGACEKDNLIMYVAKALASMDKKVLVVDTTVDQKIKYIVPSINPTKSYIVDFEDIDFAIGFNNMEEIQKYLGIKIDETNEENEKNNKKEAEMPYDYALINIDSPEFIEKFDIENASKIYFVTTFEMYSLKKGIEILSQLNNMPKVTKVLCNFNINDEDVAYLDYLSMECKITWNSASIYLPKSMEDEQALQENQRVFKIRIRKLSQEYQEGIFYITQDILNEKSSSKIKRSVKE